MARHNSSQVYIFFVIEEEKAQDKDLKPDTETKLQVFLEIKKP